jgi:pantoate--beta-alanine ligase
MIIFKTAAALSAHTTALQATGKTIGFVPTMGALHQGHLSLIAASQADNNYTLCSIFINPTQFNNPEDFNLYPVTVEKDIEQLVAAGCDFLFMPSTDEIYPSGHVKKHFDLGELEHILEGHYRPGHFQGVCEVVDRLLTITNPERLYLGQKDYQQCMVIKKLIEITGRQQPQLKFVNTKRENSGLAMSSRNLRLNETEKESALAIIDALQYIKKEWPVTPVAAIKEVAAAMLQQKGFIIDYVEIANADNLQPLLQYDSNKKAIALIAATLGNVRLIDNMLLN